MRNVVCRGSEHRINDCSFSTNTGGFSNHQADTQVQCQRGLFKSSQPVVPGPAVKA